MEIIKGVEVVAAGLEILAKAANFVTEGLQKYKDQFNYCFNAVREHQKNIKEHNLKGKIGFFIYQEDFFDKVDIYPAINSKEEIWCRRNTIGGENYISVYFYKLRVYRGETRWLTKPPSIEGVAYA